MLGQKNAPLEDLQLDIAAAPSAISNAEGEVSFLDGMRHSSVAYPDHKSISGNKPTRRNENAVHANISVSHKIFLWPAVNRQLEHSSANVASELRLLAVTGSPWLLRKEASRYPGNLPCDEPTSCFRLHTGRVVFPDLSIQQVSDYSTAYFNTFNRLFPLLDLDLFMDRVVTKVLCQGYGDDDPESVLALLVFALSRLAIDGVYEPSTSTNHGERSGFRGGTIERPPGLGLFNEARWRLGLMSSRCSLEAVQMFLLEATYFEACARHSEFWCSISAASMSCMFLVKSQAMDWSSHHGDLVKRAFWICVLHERSFNLEFQVANTGIEALADHVPLPHFASVLYQEQRGTNGEVNETRDSDYAYHFSAMIALSRLIKRADDVIHEYEPLSQAWKGSSAFDDC